LPTPEEPRASTVFPGAKYGPKQVTLDAGLDKAGKGTQQLNYHWLAGHMMQDIIPGFASVFGQDAMLTRVRPVIMGWLGNEMTFGEALRFIRAQQLARADLANRGIGTALAAVNQCVLNPGRAAVKTEHDVAFAAHAGHARFYAISTRQDAIAEHGQIRIHSPDSRRNRPGPCRTAIRRPGLIHRIIRITCPHDAKQAAVGQPRHGRLAIPLLSHFRIVGNRGQI
jgi:hypothetical protein